MRGTSHGGQNFKIFFDGDRRTKHYKGGITQPTLSCRLAQMEEELSVRLFERGSRRITLTNEGLLLRRRAEEILQLVDKTEKEWLSRTNRSREKSPSAAARSGRFNCCPI